MIRKYSLMASVCMLIAEVLKGSFGLMTILGLLLGVISYFVVRFLIHHIKSVWMFLLVDIPLFYVTAKLARYVQFDHYFYFMCPIAAGFMTILFCTVLGLSNPQKAYQEIGRTEW